MNGKLEKILEKKENVYVLYKLNGIFALYHPRWGTTTKRKNF